MRGGTRHRAVLWAVQLVRSQHAPRCEGRGAPQESPSGPPPPGKRSQTDQGAHYLAPGPASARDGPE